MRPRRQLPLPDFRHRPVQNLPLDLDAGQVAMSGIEIPPDYAFRPGQRVLLLEDRDDFREVLHDYLVSRSFQVTPVPSGVEGLREIIKDPFDLIVCDNDDAAGRGRNVLLGGDAGPPGRWPAVHFLYRLQE